MGSMGPGAAGSIRRFGSQARPCFGNKWPARLWGSIPNAVRAFGGVVGVGPW
jgi:hypothetical protein